ncbi:hypothetical protein DRJ17_04990 [Candidatus Woesearchaeota archaeon]|nr:MAG: hypothetical protein DRJ17_04990 [Candidatus Woesearchaeota archaeon]
MEVEKMRKEKLGKKDKMITVGLTVVLLVLIAFPFVSAQVEGNLTGDALVACQKINSVINTITLLVMSIGGGLAVLILIITGIMFMNAKDPTDKDKLGSKMRSVIIGLVIILVAPWIVQMIFTKPC